MSILFLNSKPILPCDLAEWNEISQNKTKYKETLERPEIDLREIKMENLDITL